MNSEETKYCRTSTEMIDSASGRDRPEQRKLEFELNASTFEELGVVEMGKAPLKESEPV